MSLIKCPECEKMFSDKASACPNCACPIDEMVNQETNNNISTNDNLVLCPVCNKQISIYAETCTHCGNPILKNEINKNIDNRIREFDNLSWDDIYAVLEYMKQRGKYWNWILILLYIGFIYLIVINIVICIANEFDIFVYSLFCTLGLCIYMKIVRIYEKYRAKQFYINNPRIKIKKD